ncbi:NADH-quinone oxidoreductase subunit NuoH [Ornithinimicrobium sp. INDO-MA30-4]|uniref:NADH-quinone oxidoreductase subunit NuoH n=1 Tax=Ornithinimicrobium sp. INDO-MA30-4 TaxID=2908651 RepID=UPI001F25BB02|nr:NADH-quinone oxidoreductase subunit NuoH [Ornithinimicrobium sp. INDO-MA30-4]UJH69500.1 NADH-quinone oxidoreductase subunit NuoH [Ornithinimicrobium sp. INDO-MA30-4]
MSFAHLAASMPEVMVSLPMADGPAADFSDTPWWLSLFKTVLVFVYLLLQVVVVIWFERRVIGRMQQRPGPNRFGPFGLFQTLADGLKLMMKEDVTPKGADKVMFIIAPLMVGSLAFVSFAIIPMGGEVEMFGHTTPLQLTDTPVATLLVLAVAGVGAYGFVLAGWSSGSTYPLLGGLRSTAQVISYEIAMGLALVAVFLFAGSMSTSEIVAAQDGLWYVFPLAVSFVVYIITMVGETNRLPFDLAEGEGELGGGFHTEYSSMKFGMFFLGEYINMFTVSALAATLFLGGYYAPFGLGLINDGMFNEGYWGILWFTAKMWSFIFFYVWLRGSLPRVRYDQFMKFGWKLMIPISLTWVIVAILLRSADEGFFGEGIWPLVITMSLIFVSLITAGWLIGYRLNMADEAKAESRKVPAEIDPFADGYPVPPLPGQKLIEPKPALAPASALVVGSAHDADTITEESSEDDRG